MNTLAYSMPPFGWKIVFSELWPFAHFFRSILYISFNFQFIEK